LIRMTTMWSCFVGLSVTVTVTGLLILVSTVACAVMIQVEPHGNRFFQGQTLRGIDPRGGVIPFALHHAEAFEPDRLQVA